MLSPKDRISPSSVYYCPMECEGPKVYFQPGQRCPVCRMYLVPIEEKAGHQAPAAFSKTRLPASFAHKKGEYFCPMFCEGEKTYEHPADCPVCFMKLEPIDEALLAAASFVETPSLEKSSPDKMTEKASSKSQRVGSDGTSGPSDGTSEASDGPPSLFEEQNSVIEEQNSVIEEAKPVIGEPKSVIDGAKSLLGVAKPLSGKENSLAHAGKYYCPMFCEGDKLYDAPIDCPVCGMDLVQIPLADAPQGEKGEDTMARLTRKLWLSLAFTLPVFLLSMGGMFVPLPFSPKVSGWLEFLLTLPVVFLPGWFLMQRGFRSFASGHLNMFSLIALGVSAAFLFSVVGLLFPEILPAEMVQHGRVPLYFEAVCVILTLVILGQWMEARAHRQTGKALEELMNLSPAEAHRVKDGMEENIPVNEVRVGDVLRVKPGERVPVDGRVTEGHSAIEESMISGEPLPVEKQPKDPVTAGTLNTTGTFLMVAEKVGEDTVLAKIIHLVNAASRSKAPIQKLADRISRVFVPVVILISVLTFFLWLMFGEENRWVMALANAVAVLIVACPCALGLATPMSLMVGIGKGARHGILIKNAEALEAMEKIQFLVTDKTGTLTEGKPTVENIITDGATPAEVLRLAALLNQSSEHPLAGAVLSRFKQENPSAVLGEVADFQALAGEGLRGRVGEDTLLLGTAELMQRYAITLSAALKEQAAAPEHGGKTLSYLAKNGKVLGFLTYTDPIRSTAQAAVNYLKKQGIAVTMLTGDNPETARQVAKEVGIPDFHGKMSPAGKIDFVKGLQQSGRTVAMTGDGINDAPALAQADVGIAMGTGSDVAIDTAEITLLRGDLLGVARAHILSRKLRQNIRQNLFFAFFYNFIGIPVAAGLLYPFFGTLLSPMLAAAAMSFSSVSVILNSLRLNAVSLDVK